MKLPKSKSKSKTKTIFMDSRKFPSSNIMRKRIPTVSTLIARKYFYPAIEQDDKIRAQKITQFISHQPDQHFQDTLHLGESINLYDNLEYLKRFQRNPSQRIKRFTMNHNTSRSCLSNTPSLYFFDDIQKLISQNRKSKKLFFRKNQGKQQFSKSTQATNKIAVNILGKNEESITQQLSESSEIYQMLKNLKKVTQNSDGKKAKKHNQVKYFFKPESYQTKIYNKIQIIENIEKQISSIHELQSNKQSFDWNESMYGLSDFHKKSQQIKSKLKSKKNEKSEKKLSTRLLFCKPQLKKVTQNDKSNKLSSFSKNSRRSQSNKNNKNRNSVSNTPDNKNKNKSISQKKGVRLQKKVVIPDAEKIYYDNIVAIQPINSALKEKQVYDEHPQACVKQKMKPKKSTHHLKR